jgi:hypothetical protein
MKMLWQRNLAVVVEVSRNAAIGVDRIDCSEVAIGDASVPEQQTALGGLREIMLWSKQFAGAHGIWVWPAWTSVRRGKLPVAEEDKFGIVVCLQVAS